MTKQILFYGPNDTFGFMSNFSDHPFDYANFYYKTSEHFFQSMKLVFPSDRELVRNAPTPGKAASLGRELEMKDDWNDPDNGPTCAVNAFSDGKEDTFSAIELVKDRVMLQALRLKFEAHPEIMKELRTTGKSLLIENAPSDKYWGCGKSKNGRNKLGILLQVVRDGQQLQ